MCAQNQGVRAYRTFHITLFGAALCKLGEGLGYSRTVSFYTNFGPCQQVLLRQIRNTGFDQAKSLHPLAGGPPFRRNCARMGHPAVVWHTKSCRLVFCYVLDGSGISIDDLVVWEPVDFLVAIVIDIGIADV